jgi:D-alanyl-D-alanine carboxypeptidase
MSIKTYIKYVICIFLLAILLLISFETSIFALDIAVPKIYSPSVILIDADSGKILYEKNINERKYPASLTKVMTAIIVIENCELTEVATVSKNAVTSIPDGYVTAELKERRNFNC